MKDNSVTIIKNGKLVDIDEDNLCRNDMVLVQTGDIVPADLRLVETAGLEVDEFDLTGEIMPVIKKAQNDTMLYMGSKIIKGFGRGIVVAKGDQTEYGSILKQMWESEDAHKLQLIKIKYFILIILLLPPFAIQTIQSQNSATIIVFYLILSAALILLQNDDLIKHYLTSNAIKKYEKDQIQIRDITVLELLNKIDVVCFDKTGVLTTRQMEVKGIYYGNSVQNVSNLLGTGKMSHMVKIACALCNDILFFEKIKFSNSIDKALIFFASKNGLDINKILVQSKRIYAKPFDSENRHMVCGYKIEDLGVYYFTKGDPDVILKMCSCYLTKSGRKKVDSSFWFFCNENITAIDLRGNTTIALAYSSGSSNIPPQKYTFLCLLELENSLRHEAHDVIKEIAEKRMRTIMLTGDRIETAKNISEECGIKDSGACLTGNVIERMALSEVSRQSERCSVFARLLPSQKGVIIRLFQQKGHSVAMIGDGPNDGIALKVADISISFVRNSSPIARRLSKILINELSDLLTLMEEAYKIKKTTKYLNLLRILMLAAIFLGLYFWFWLQIYF